MKKYFKYFYIPSNFLQLLFFIDTAKVQDKKSSYFELAIALYLLGIFFILFEVISPHGFTGFLGILGVVGGLVMSFLYGPPVYSVALGIFTVVGMPVIFYLIYKKMQLKGGLAEKQASYLTALTNEEEKLIGKQGIALTTLRPSGIVLIENKKVDAVSERDIIEKNEKVEVVKVEGIRVVVRKVSK
jgi:membrane-bound serine protease (ClpP class)